MKRRDLLKTLAASGAYGSLNIFPNLAQAQTTALTPGLVIRNPKLDALHYDDENKAKRASVISDWKIFRNLAASGFLTNRYFANSSQGYASKNPKYRDSTNQNDSYIKYFVHIDYTNNINGDGTIDNPYNKIPNKLNANTKYLIKAGNIITWDCRTDTTPIHIRYPDTIISVYNKEIGDPNNHYEVFSQPNPFDATLNASKANQLSPFETFAGWEKYYFRIEGNGGGSGARYFLYSNNGDYTLQQVKDGSQPIAGRGIAIAVENVNAIVRGVWVDGAAHSAVVVKNVGPADKETPAFARIEDCIFTNTHNIPFIYTKKEKKENTETVVYAYSDPGVHIRFWNDNCKNIIQYKIDSNGKQVAEGIPTLERLYYHGAKYVNQVVRCFMANAGSDAIWSGSDNKDLIVHDCVIKAHPTQLVFEDIHSDGIQVGQNPGKFEIKRCIIEHFLPEQLVPTVNQYAQATTNAAIIGKIPQGHCFVTSGSGGSIKESYNDNEGTISDSIFMSNAVGINYSPGTGSKGTHKRLVVMMQRGMTSPFAKITGINANGDDKDKSYTATKFKEADCATLFKNQGYADMMYEGLYKWISVTTDPKLLATAAAALPPLEVGTDGKTYPTKIGVMSQLNNSITYQK